MKTATDLQMPEPSKTLFGGRMSAGTKGRDERRRSSLLYRKLSCPRPKRGRAFPNAHSKRSGEKEQLGCKGFGMGVVVSGYWIVADLLPVDRA